MFRRFLASWILLLMVVLGAIAIGNFFVDPFGIYPNAAWSKLDGFRDLDSRTAKAELIRRSAPHTLIAGSSRALTALDPDDSSLDGTKAINVGLSATNLFEIARTIRYSLEHGSPERVILGLDFLLFSSARTTNQDFVMSRLNPDRTVIEYQVESLLSYRALYASAQTIRNLIRKRAQPIDPINGFRHMNLDRLAGSQRELFQVALGPYLGPTGTYTQFDLSDDRLRLLADLLAELRDREIETHLLILPVHAVQLSLIEAVGLWEAFETWKRAVAAIAEREGVGPIWDFAMAGPLQVESIPSADDVTTRMNWFFESSHSRPTFGALCLGQVLGRSRPKDLAPEVWTAISLKLDPTRMEEVLAAQRALLSAWSADHPEDVAMVRRLVEELGAR